jgi:hypothetical protein
MPLLDISSVLTDPLFVDRTLICVREKQSVGEDGIAVNKPSSIPLTGIVTANSGNSLFRQPDGSHIESTITIHTRFRLEDGKTGRAAHLIKWCGKQYTVINVTDYSTYGRGFVQATAQLIELSGGN